jgi:hypothetical protein
MARRVFPMKASNIVYGYELALMIQTRLHELRRLRAVVKLPMQYGTVAVDKLDIDVVGIALAWAFRGRL